MTDAEIIELVRKYPTFGYRKLWRFILAQGHTATTQRRVRRLQSNVRIAQRYGRFRICWMDKNGKVHPQGENLYWNESQATRAAMLVLASINCPSWIEFQKTEASPWRRW